MGNAFSPQADKNCCTGSPEAKKANLVTTPSSKTKIKLLFGCLTEQDHNEYIQDACESIKEKHGEAGLDILGLEFRFFHNPDCNCTKSAEARLSVVEEEHVKREGQQNSSVPSDNDVFSKDLDVGRRDYRKALSDLSLDLGSDHGDGDIVEEEEDDIENERHISFSKRDEFLVPIGEPISRESSLSDLQQAGWGVRTGSERSAGTAFTMFSLATHHTLTSSVSSGELAFTKGECTMRLFHKSTNTLITEHNHDFFVAHGKMYDEVARLCMEYAQDVMMKEGDLEWQNMGNGVGALVTRNRCFRKPTLLAITGKGKVVAGIFSRRYLMTSGLEVSTALPFVREAIRRNMDVVILDPNVNGSQQAMKVVEKSLERLFLQQGTGEEAVYVLAHSMAGSQLVRFLLNKTFLKGDKGSMVDDKHAGLTFLNQIRAVAFTDSNHNINWTKRNPLVTKLLIGPASIYIKSHKVHDEPKVLGQLQEDCDFWKHRFGAIKTIWAGTSEHALTNYTGFSYIWDHFDNFLTSDEDGSNHTDEKKLSS